MQDKLSKAQYLTFFWAVGFNIPYPQSQNSAMDDICMYCRKVRTLKAISIGDQKFERRFCGISCRLKFESRLRKKPPKKMIVQMRKRKFKPKTYFDYLREQAEREGKVFKKPNLRYTF